MPTDPILTTAALRLLQRAPDDDWWPGVPWTVAVSAILVQQTTWKQAWRAVERLGEAALSPASLSALSDAALGDHIRCSGFWRRKRQTLRILADRWDQLAAQSPIQRRTTLLKITGIGPETADAICCYAFNDAVLVVDAMTARLTTRLTGQAVPFNTVTHYAALQRRWTEALPTRNNQAMRRLHAAIVEHARGTCPARQAACSRCVLRPLCAHGQRNRTTPSASN